MGSFLTVTWSKYPMIFISFLLQEMGMLIRSGMSYTKWSCHEKSETVNFKFSSWRYKGIVEVLTDTLNRTSYEINKLSLKYYHGRPWTSNIVSKRQQFMSGIFWPLLKLLPFPFLPLFCAFIIWRLCIEMVSTCSACPTGLTEPWSCLWYCTSN